MFNKRLTLETNRLQIIPLTHNQLINYLQVDGSLEEDLGIQPLKRNIGPEVIETFEKIILPAVGIPSRNYLFSTVWTIIDKGRKVMVGDYCFKGEANNKGEIEIIYDIYLQFRNKGYMTEAIGAICQWAFEQREVSYIQTKTSSKNIASQKVLEKNRFIPLKKENEIVWWQLQNTETLAIERA